MNVNVIYEDLIKPSCPTPNHLRFLPTSLFDEVNSPVLMPLIFFFTSQNSIINTKISTKQVLDRLKTSLPKTLSVFYPLAGRVHDVNHIKCNDEGVPYVEAKVDKPFKDVIHKAKLAQLDKLLPQYGQKAGFTRLLLAIQVNVFACGGLAIGVLMNHAISDAFSFLMFVKTWASMAKSADSSHILAADHPNFHIWKLFPPRLPTNNNDDVKVNPDPSLIRIRPVAKWFMFSKTNLYALKSLMLYPSTSTRNLPSLALMLSSFIWSRIKATCHNSVTTNIPLVIFYPVNLRPKVAKCGEGSYYFGNMFVNAMVKPSMVLYNDDADDNNHSSDEPSRRRNLLRQTKESISKVSSDDGFIRKLEEGKESLRFMMEMFERESRGEIVLHGFSNLRSLPVYEADFGWGKPVWVTSATLILNNLVILIPAHPTTKDIVAYVNLSSADMAKLEGDAEFNAFVSKAPGISSKL